MRRSPAPHSTRPLPARRWPVILALLVVPLISLASAATARSGAIEGRIWDLEERRPLGGVRVILEGPALPRPIPTATGRDGRFRFPALPPGRYELEAFKDGYATVEQTDIQLAPGRTVTLDLEVFTAFDDDEVIITGSAPVLDVTSATAVTVFDDDLLRRLPLERGLEELPTATPVVVPVREGFGPLSISGGGPRDNLFYIDDLDVTSPLSGTQVVHPPPEALSHMGVVTNSPPAWRPDPQGGVVELLTRRGSPATHGGFFLWSAPGDLSAEPDATAAGRRSGRELAEGGLTLGGTLWPKRVFYFFALDWLRETQELITRQGVTTEREEERRTGLTRLSFQSSAPGEEGGSDLDQRLELTAFSQPRDVTDEILPGALGLLGHDGETGGRGASLVWQGALSRRLFLEVQGGRFAEDAEVRPLADRALYQDLSTDGRWAALADCGPAATPDLGADRGSVFAAGCRGGTVRRTTEDVERHQVEAVLRWFSGARGQVDAGTDLPREHAVTLGVQWRRAESLDRLLLPGAVAGPFFDRAGGLVDANGLSGQLWTLGDDGARLEEIEGAARRQVEEVALFADERLRLGQHLVLHAGLRATEVDGDLESGVGAGPGVGGRTRLDFGLEDTLAPRLALVWDIQGNGRSRFHAHLGRHVDTRPPLLEGLPYGLFPRRVHQFEVDPGFEADPGALPTVEDPGRRVDSVLLNRRIDVDPRLDPASFTEARLGIQLEPLPDITVGFSVLQRSQEEMVEDVSLDGGQTRVVLNPEGRVLRDPVSGEPLASPVFLPRVDRDFQALQVRLDKGFLEAGLGGGWQLHAGYTFVESEGNYGGAEPAADGALLTPELDLRYDLPGLIPQGSGRLVGDRRHQWRVLGSYRWGNGLTTGAFFRYFSGAPFPRLGAHPLLGRNSRFIGPPDAGGRLPELWHLDFRFAYPMELSGLTVELMADLFNLTDRQEPVRVDTEWTFVELPATVSAGEASTNPEFGRPLERQQPRSLRLGLRLRF